MGNNIEINIMQGNISRLEYSLDVAYADDPTLVARLDDLNGEVIGVTASAKVAAAIDSKEAIAGAVTAKGVEITDNVPLSEYADKIGEIPTPPITVEGTPGDGFPVRFFDYDGTLLKTHYVHKGEDATPPELPEHEYLSFQQWNNDVSNIQGPTDAGALYDTKDGASYFFVCLYSDNKTIGCPHIVTGGTTTIEWGDGEVSTNSGTFTETHTYAKTGSYVIRMTATEGATVSMDTNGVSFANYNLAYTVKRMYLSDFVRYVRFQQTGIYSAIESMTFSANTNVNQCAHIGSRLSIIIQNEKSYLGCKTAGVRHVILNRGRTAMPGEYLEMCYYILSLIIPDTIQTVIFGYKPRVQVLVLQQSTPPTLQANGGIFGKVYVPQGSLEAYKAATGWSALANIMEEYTEETILW